MFNITRLIICTAAFAGVVGCSNLTPDASAYVQIGSASVPLPRVATLKQNKEQNIFMQQYDYSCGAASMATLLHFYFGDDFDEQTMLARIKTIFSREEYKRIERDGLSFRELELISKALGYQSASVHLTRESLSELTGPVIVYLERTDYRHFAVLKGVHEDRVFIADPSRGNIRVSLPLFLREWDGRTFIMGKAGFGTPTQHSLSLDEAHPLRNEVVSLRNDVLAREGNRFRSRLLQQSLSR